MLSNQNVKTEFVFTQSGSRFLQNNFVQVLHLSVTINCSNSRDQTTHFRPPLMYHPVCLQQIDCWVANSCSIVPDDSRNFFQIKKSVKTISASVTTQSISLWRQMRKLGGTNNISRLFKSLINQIVTKKLFSFFLLYLCKDFNRGSDCSQSICESLFEIIIDGMFQNIFFVISRLLLNIFLPVNVYGLNSCEVTNEWFSGR